MVGALRSIQLVPQQLLWLLNMQSLASLCSNASGVLPSSIKASPRAWLLYRPPVALAASACKSGRRALRKAESSPLQSALPVLRSIAAGALRLAPG